jgi:hypothetical protein
MIPDATVKYMAPQSQYSSWLGYGCYATAFTRMIGEFEISLEALAPIA